MLDRFHVPPDIEVRVPQDDMRATVEDIFLKMGVPSEDATQAEDVLVYADVRGIESHGVSNMLRMYVAEFGKGTINPRPNWRIERETDSAATIDCDRGHGVILGPKGMEIAINKARNTGVGVVTMVNGRHFGAAAYHAALALEHDMIGWAMTVGQVNMLPTFGAVPMVGVYPLAFAAPTRDEPPFIFDAAMGSIAGNKVRLAERVGTNLLPGWIAKSDGTPIMEETEVPEQYHMLPLGSTRELGSHKGYGLAAMIDILCNVLGGSDASFQHQERYAAHHFIAYDIEAFTDREQFKDRMDAFMKGLRETPPAPGHERVYYAGLPEHEAEIDRSANGIPYHPDVIEWFRDITSELEIPYRFG